MYFNIHLECALAQKNMTVIRRKVNKLGTLNDSFLSVHILGKILQPHLHGPIRVQHTDEVA